MTVRKSTAAVSEQPDRADKPKRAAWCPKKPATLIGVFEGLATRANREGQANIVALVRTDEGRLLEVWTYPVVLRRAMERAAPSEGDRIKIERLGKHISTKGYRYVMYRVEILNRAESDGPTPPGNGPSGSDQNMEGGTR